MALKGVLRPGYIQIRVTDLGAALKHYVDRVGLHEVSREAACTGAPGTSSTATASFCA
jgi:hypothetical protein